MSVKTDGLALTPVRPPGKRQNDDTNLIRHRRIVRSISDVLDTFRDLNTHMPVGEVAMFLQVALNEGESQTELADRMGMSRSTASRYLLDLSEKTRTGAAGYGLVFGETDPDELRRKVYTLSPKGRNVIKKLVEGAKGGVNGNLP